MAGGTEPGQAEICLRATPDSPSLSPPCTAPTPLPAGDPGRFVPLDWLDGWANGGVEAAPEPVDNSQLLCAHSKLDPAKLPGESAGVCTAAAALLASTSCMASCMPCTLTWAATAARADAVLPLLRRTHLPPPSRHPPSAAARRISTPAWQALLESCRGGPELSPADACPVCLAAQLDAIAAQEDTQAGHMLRLPCSTAAVAAGRGLAAALLRWRLRSRRRRAGLLR